MIRLIFYLLFAVYWSGCSPTNFYQRSVKRYLNNLDTASMDKNLDDSFRSFFIERKGEGTTKVAYINSMNTWDVPLHPDYTIKKIESEGNKITVEVIESNDFAKGIGFPGWQAKIIYTVSESGKILEQVYIPGTSPDYRTWLKPALEWLQQNRPKELPTVYDTEKKRLIKTHDSAIIWVKLLKEWRAAITP